MSSESVKPTLPTLQERYEACMLLHAVGDAMGYKNGKWEFTFSGRDIHDQLTQLGGVENLNLDPKDWRVSDDTILHLAVAECLISTYDWSPGEKVWNSLIDNYKYAMTDMNGRAPGSTTQTSIHDLSKIREKGYQIPFNIRGGGCGASMRSSCIGLRYAEEDQKENLVAFAIESGRMTHHHPIGYLGALAAALFTSYAIQGHRITSWGAKFIEDLSLAQKYVEETNHSKEESLAAWYQVTIPWKNYLKIRKIETGKENEAYFPDKYGVEERDKFYKKITNSEWAGANGIDSVLIAYDGILGCKANWKELCLRAMLHGGDNDSTGCIAGSWFGALYGFDTVPKKNYESLEYKDRIKKIGNELYDIHNKDLKTSKRSTE